MGDKNGSALLEKLSAAKDWMMEKLTYVIYDYFFAGNIIRDIPVIIAWFGAIIFFSLFASAKEEGARNLFGTGVFVSLTGLMLFVMAVGFNLIPDRRRNKDGNIMLVIRSVMFRSGVLLPMRLLRNKPERVSSYLELLDVLGVYQQTTEAWEAYEFGVPVLKGEVLSSEVPLVTALITERGIKDYTTLKSLLHDIRNNSAAPLSSGAL